VRTDRAGAHPNGAVGARLNRKRPAELLLERMVKARPRAATPLQLISCSATITADLRRQIGSLLGGGATKRAAGLVVTTGPVHPGPRTLKKFGVGGVTMPSTIKHSAYLGKPAGLDQMLMTAFEELVPAAALLVIPNGHSVPRRVEALRALGFEQAQALQDALGVPASRPTGSLADGAQDTSEATGMAMAPRRRPASGETLQGEMVGKRQELAQAFARREATVPLLVTTEHSARGMDFKAIDAVFLVGLPARVDSYVHVAGRTAREGRKGRAVCLLTQQEEFERLSSFGRELGIQIEKVDLRFLGRR